jgi:hypothetical protein
MTLPPAFEVLFHAGDAGDGCYRVDDGLLKVTIRFPPPWTTFYFSILIVRVVAAPHFLQV